jgi:hypothetical protein
MIAFAATVIACSDRQAKSISLSGCPSAKSAEPPAWPVSVDAEA